MDTSGAMIFAFLILLVLLVFYFLPAIVASYRRHRERLSIFMLNLFLGWSLIGWVLALVWACTSNRETGAT